MYVFGWRVRGIVSVSMFSTMYAIKYEEPKHPGRYHIKLFDRSPEIDAEVGNAIKELLSLSS